MNLNFNDVDPNATDNAAAINEADDLPYLGEPKKKLSRNGITFIGIILAAGAAIAFMTLRGGPRPASASTVTPVAASTDSRIATFLIGGSANIQAMQDMLRHTEKVVRQFMSYPATTQIPLGDLKTNPFRQAEARLAPADIEAAQKRREAERGAALKAVQGLQLQSILFSDVRRACMINGTLLTEGQELDSFTIDKISAASVIVRTGAYRFELKMQP